MESAGKRNPWLEAGEEASLVRAAQGGDAQAFARIVRHYQRAVYRVAYGLTRNPSDADDLAQETFVRAYRALDRFRVGEPLYPWLSRIAVNLSYSLYRHRRRRPETPLEPLLEAGRQWSGGQDPSEEVEERERRQHLGEAFDALSEEHRAILVLRVVEGLSYDEISRALGIPAGTVMSRLSRARSELKTRLKARTGESS
jgi:RNA polymerase sigma-70 factor (ECF subfamily)